MFPKSPKKLHQQIQGKFDRAQLRGLCSRGWWLKDWAAKELGKPVPYFSILLPEEMLALDARLESFLQMNGGKK